MHIAKNQAKKMKKVYFSLIFPRRAHPGEYFKIRYSAVSDQNRRYTFAFFLENCIGGERIECAERGKTGIIL